MYTDCSHWLALFKRDTAIHWNVTTSCTNN